MTLSNFITDNIDALLDDWDAFARSLEPSIKHMSEAELRDDARQIIKSIAAELAAHESGSKSSAPAGAAAFGSAERRSAAAVHGASRHTSGFTLPQVKAEYAALRDSVLDKWLPTCPPSPSNDAEIGRFDATLDAALRDSVACYERQQARLRDNLGTVLSQD